MDLVLYKILFFFKKQVKQPPPISEDMQTILSIQKMQHSKHVERERERERERRKRFFPTRRAGLFPCVFDFHNRKLFQFSCRIESGTSKPLIISQQCNLLLLFLVFLLKVNFRRSYFSMCVLSRRVNITLKAAASVVQYTHSMQMQVSLQSPLTSSRPYNIAKGFFFFK